MTGSSTIRARGPRSAGADGAGSCRVAEHAGHSVSRDVIKSGVKLRGQNSRGRGEYFADSASVLGDQ